MCGINGIITHKKINLQKIIRQMNDAITHRGPDNEGTFFYENIALGHRRLSIIDLSDAAKQPFTDNSGRFVLVYNGEIYNYKNIKAEIPEYKFKTNSDSEVLLAAYIKRGKECLSMLEGMFAFAIFDTKKNEVFIARDRIGIKPLYYFQDDEKILFSSEIKALLSSGLIPRKINKSAVFDYVRYQTVHAPETIISGIKMLMPGHFAIIKNNSVKITQYWNLKKPNYKEETSYEEIKSKVKELLYKSVEKRLVSDVPLGAFLSGGIDSSIITGIMSEISNSKINTFSVNFDEAEFSEGKYARQIAGLFKTNHTEILLKPDDFLKNLPDALKFIDHPSGDGPNSYIVSKVTKKAGITVALSGLGGDELFAGYDVFKKIHKFYNHKQLSKIPFFIRNSASKLLPLLKNDIRTKKIASILSTKKFDLENMYPVFRLLYNDKDLLKFFSSKSIENNVVKKIVSEITVKKNYILSSVSSSEMKTYMQNVLLRDTDQMSMASSLEVRVPFLDYQLIEYVYNIPDKYKFPYTPKKLLTDSVNILPDNIINRPKMGFVLPWEHWLKNELFDFSDSRIKSLAERDFFNTPEILNVWNNFLKGKKNVSWARLWIFIVLEDYINKMNLSF